MSFLPLDLTDPDSIEYVISHIDFTMQYGEDEEPKEVNYVLYCALLLSFTHTSLFSRAIWMRETLRGWNRIGWIPVLVSSLPLL